MSGRCQGVQVHVREQCKSPSLYVHYHAHRLNLVLVSACNNNRSVVNALGLMEGIYSFVRASTVRHDLFTQCQRDEGNPVLSLPQQRDTRWVCKHKAVIVFKSRFTSIRTPLSHLASFCMKELNELKLLGC